jgi:putative flippase GtrA
MDVTAISRLINKNHYKHIEPLKYGIVSAVALGTDIFALMALKQIADMSYLSAASISFLIGLTINYLLSIYWVFNASRVTKRSVEFIGFAIIGVVGLAITDLIIWLMSDELGFYYIGAKIVAAIMVFFWNFGARKKYLFT